jgi:hypothetical protein
MDNTCCTEYLLLVFAPVALVAFLIMLWVPPIVRFIILCLVALPHTLLWLLGLWARGFTDGTPTPESYFVNTLLIGLAVLCFIYIVADLFWRWRRTHQKSTSPRGFEVIQPNATSGTTRKADQFSGP